jgi:NAD dependent epimerase/dehydratase family enzyme
MASQGGIFRVLTRTVYWFIGAILGTGKQWQSWIHMDDLVEIFHQSLINSSAAGVYNAVAPEPIRHGDMIRMIAKKLKRPLIFPAIPTWFLKIILGEMADLVTGGNLVSSQKIQKELTFTFKFTSFAEAIKKLTYV